MATKEIEIYHPSLLDLLFGGLGVIFLFYILFQDKPDLPIFKEEGYYALSIRIDSIKGTKLPFVNIRINDQEITNIKEDSIPRFIKSFNYSDDVSREGRTSYFSFTNPKEMTIDSKIDFLIDTDVNGHFVTASGLTYLRIIVNEYYDHRKVKESVLIFEEPKLKSIRIDENRIIRDALGYITKLEIASFFFRNNELIPTEL